MNSFTNKQIENRKSKIENPQSGIAMVTVIIMTSLLIMIGIAMNRRSGINISASPNQLKKQDALYIAEAGVQHTLFELMKNTSLRGDIFTNKRFGNGFYNTKALLLDPLTDIVITSTGTVEDAGTIIAKKTVTRIITPDVGGGGEFKNSYSR